MECKETSLRSAYKRHIQSCVHRAHSSSSSPNDSGEEDSLFDDSECASEDTATIENKLFGDDDGSDGRAVQPEARQPQPQSDSDGTSDGMPSLVHADPWQAHRPEYSDGW